MNDKRDQLYNNLINSGKVSEAEIGSLEDFKAAISDEAKTREFYNIEKLWEDAGVTVVPNLD